MDNINFGTFIRDIDHLCTPTQLSYAVVNRYGVSDYSPVNTECLGMYGHTYIILTKFNYIYLTLVAGSVSGFQLERYVC